MPLKTPPVKSARRMVPEVVSISWVITVPEAKYDPEARVVSAPSVLVPEEAEVSSILN